MKEKKVTDKATLEGFTKDSSLDKYANKILFKDKVKKANEILKTVGIPKA